MAKPQTAFDGALAVVEGMDNPLHDAWMFAQLVDRLLSSAMDDHPDGYYRLTKHEGHLIAFAAGKAVEAVRACQDQLAALDPRTEGRAK